MDRPHRGSRGPGPRGVRALRAAALAAALALPLATAGGAAAQEAAESSAITALYTSLLSAVGKEAVSEGAGWAMSAIGLSGGESAELAAIGAELQQIDADLKNINNTLTQILNAIEEQTCNSTQIASSLQDAVNDITELYNEYQTFVANATRMPPLPPTKTQVLAWQNDVLGHVPSYLNAIHNGVYATVSANVISQCAQSTADAWREDNPTKTETTFLDDRPSYAQLIDIINYYYGVQVQGTTILVEAYHLQACQAAANHDSDLHCDFTTPSTSTSASEAEEVCDGATDSSVQSACLAAEEVVTFPETGTGTYERVEAWLTAAGAPYATDQLGILSSIDSSTSSWGSSYAYLFPRDLLDFTNNATINGATLSHCSSPLTSTQPCGLTVGRYDLALTSGVSYGGISGHWKSATADVLLLLLHPYNHNDFGDRSGTLGEFMASIGFSEALETAGLIVTTANTGPNGDFGFPAICFMDTSSTHNAHKQPWCDDISGQVQGTDDLLTGLTSGCTAEEGGFTHDLGQPDFYFARILIQTGNPNCPKSSIYPGWAVSAQDSSDPDDRAIFWQYHWPVTNVPEIGCQNGKPYLNPGGLLSRCAGDLQEYVDALLPPPDSDTTALAASGDATLVAAEPNRNTGAELLLGLGRGDELVVQFDDLEIQRFWEGGELASAILRLSPAERGSPRRLAIVPILDGFVEGNGAGSGATWHCAEDADVGDDAEHCLRHWPRSLFGAVEARWPDHQDRAAGLLGWDVSEDIRAGVYAWLIRAPARHGDHRLVPVATWRDGAGRGAHDGDRHARTGAYHAREGAVALREPFRAPTLLLEREPSAVALAP